MGREAAENLDAKVVDNVSTTYLSTVKYSRGENNFPFGSLGRVYCGRPKAEGKFQYAANLDINKICPNQRSHYHVFACT
jgi:hypothetical protein